MQWRHKNHKTPHVAYLASYFFSFLSFMFLICVYPSFPPLLCFWAERYMEWELFFSSVESFMCEVGKSEPLLFTHWPPSLVVDIVEPSSCLAGWPHSADFTPNEHLKNINSVNPKLQSIPHRWCCWFLCFSVPPLLPCWISWISAREIQS